MARGNYDSRKIIGLARIAPLVLVDTSRTGRVDLLAEVQRSAKQQSRLSILQEAGCAKTLCMLG